MSIKRALSIYYSGTVSVPRIIGPEVQFVAQDQEGENNQSAVHLKMYSRSVTPLLPITSNWSVLA